MHQIGLCRRGPGASQSHLYDPLSRLTQISNNLSGSAQDASFNFDYNPASQIDRMASVMDLRVGCADAIGSPLLAGL